MPNVTTIAAARYRCCQEKRAFIDADTVSSLCGMFSVPVPSFRQHDAPPCISRQPSTLTVGIFIKSGEGNQGDTWWDSGVIQKVRNMRVCIVGRS